MLVGLSYGEIFVLLGATVAVIGPKDLPLIARTAGRLAGRAIGYVQLARGQLDSVIHQTQARQVHKELQDTMAQLEAIRHEIRTISVLSPSPLTRTLHPMGSPSEISQSCTLHSQATAYARLAQSDAPFIVSDPPLLNVLPLSAHTSGLLPTPKDDLNGSDIFLEALLEADVAQNAKQFFSLPQNQIKNFEITTTNTRDDVA